MRSIVYIQNSNELELLRSSECRDIILAPKSFSRRGTIDWNSALSLAHEAQKYGMKVALEWDALMTEGLFLNLTSELSKGELPFSSIRVRDAGAAFWIKKNYPHIKIQLLLEAGHHNLLALKSWIIRLGTQLERVCLSPELPATVLSSWKKQIDIEFEVLGLGPLLLFHSGRALLSPLDSAPEQEELFAEGASEESPHKGFILQENHHGTLMFHPKDLSLLERWDDLKATGIDVVRLDHRHQQDQSIFTKLISFAHAPTPAKASEIKEAWDRDWMRGYFDVNKSDVLFSKLKNTHLRQRDGESVGEVLEGKRESWLAVLGKGNGLKMGQQVLVIDPKGKTKEQTIHWLKDSDFNPTDFLSSGEVGFISWFPGAPTKSALLTIAD